MNLRTLVRFYLIVQLGLVATIGTLGHGTGQEATPSGTPLAAGEWIEIRGGVASPGSFTIDDLRALPAKTVDVTYLMENGTEVQHSFTGARLWDVLQLAQPTIDPELPESSLRLYLVLTAKDGYVVVLSMGEIDPEFGAQPYLLAWDEDGQALDGERSPAVLVAPGDRTEGRYIHGLVSIEVRSVE